MNRTPRLRRSRMFRPWGLDRRAWQRLAASGALAVAVSTASWSWVLASPAVPTPPPAIVRLAGHGAGPSSAVYGVTDAPAAGLRVTLNNLLAEHVYLAARATGAALGNRMPEFEAAAAALDANSVDLSKAIGLAYGPDAEAAFLPLWRSHIGMVVDYTVGKATNDETKQQKAVNALVGYTQDFGAFLSGANENLPKDVVADLVKSHVLTLKDVIDAQAAGDQPRVYESLRLAMGHMQMIADPLASATAMKYPDKFSGQAVTPASTLRVTLNHLLAEHVYLASSATGGALGKREAQFKAAADQLDANSVDLSKAIGAAYGGDAEMAFLPLWRSHIGMVVDYTVGKATNDEMKQQKAVNDLVGYTQDFGAFLSAANENLPKEVVADLVKSHVLTLKDVIDAQAAGDPKAQFTAIRAAGHHMGMIADPLAEATAVKFPDKFQGMATTPQDDGHGASHSHSQLAPAGSSTAGPAGPAVELRAYALAAQDGTEQPTEIRQFAFQPKSLEVPAGTTVVWTNQDAIQHSVTAADGVFDSGFFTQGGTFAYTFDQPGTYAYYCARHGSMQGEVVVTG
jgi:plastocyanin